jgi:uncharacterized protein YjiS (DUF1127 family)
MSESSPPTVSPLATARLIRHIRRWERARRRRELLQDLITTILVVLTLLGGLLLGEWP